MYNTEYDSSMVTSALAARSLFSLVADFPEMDVITSPISPQFSNEQDIKVLLFDIYGTLLISEAGDIGLASLNEDQKELPFVLQASGKQFQHSYAELKERLLEHVKQEHLYIKKTKAGIVYPEVDIIRLWCRIYHDLGYDDYSIENICSTALHFELLSNKVSLMPGGVEVLSALHNAGYKLGIVSNAQFYTPVILEHLCQTSLENLGFLSPLTSWSYEQACGKPDPLIFAPVMKTLDDWEVKAREVMYIGNDMLNDIYSASNEGLKTILFAGDKRSLRMRAGDKRVENLRADHIIDNLWQVLEILGEE